MDYRLLIPLAIVGIIIIVSFIIGASLTYQSKNSDYYRAMWYTPKPDWAEYLKLIRERYGIELEEKKAADKEKGGEDIIVLK